MGYVTFWRFYTCKKPLLSTNHKGGLFLYFGRKSSKIKQNNAKPGFGAVELFLPRPVFMIQKVKMQVFFLRFFALQTNRKRDDAAGVEPKI